MEDIENRENDSFEREGCADFNVSDPLKKKQPAKTETSKKPVETFISSSEKNLRPNDEDSFEPSSYVVSRAEITQEEINQKYRDETEDAQIDTSQSGGFLLGDFKYLLIVIACILGLLILFDVVRFAKDVSDMPPFIKYFCYAALFVFFGTIAFVCQKIWNGFGEVKLGEPPLSLSSYNSPEKLVSAKNRCLSVLNGISREKLSKYVVEKDPEKKTSTINGLMAQKEELEQGGSTTREWLESYKNFQGELKKIAGKRKNVYCIRVASLTALCPFSIIDRMIVVYYSLQLISDIFEIFGRKSPSNFITVQIFSKAIFNIYFSGIASDYTEYTGELVDILKDSIGTQFSAKILSKISGKAAEGVINAFLLHRLGKYTINSLCIVKE